MKRNRNIVLLLTACIAPKDINVKVSNEEERLLSYMNALSFYLDNTYYPIVFVDSSGFDMTPYYAQDVANGRLECLHFEGTFNKKLGKGYGEAQIIEFAFGRSKFLQSSLYVAKITGRLIIKNILNLFSILDIKKPNCIYIDVDIKLIYAQSRCFIGNRYFFMNYFLPLKTEIDDSVGNHFERVLAKALRKWKNDGYRHSLFLIPEYIIGVSGSLGVPYKKPCFSRYFTILMKFFLYKIQKRKSYDTN